MHNPNTNVDSGLNYSYITSNSCCEILSRLMTDWFGIYPELNCSIWKNCFLTDTGKVRLGFLITHLLSLLWRHSEVRDKCLCESWWTLIKNSGTKPALWWYLQRSITWTPFKGFNMTERARNAESECQQRLQIIIGTYIVFDGLLKW